MGGQTQSLDVIMVAQGIDSNWNLHSIPIAFQHVTGPHTGQAIKKQFEEIATNFNIRSKVFKIVADQAANVKNAFKEVIEAEDVLTIACDLIRRQKNQDALDEKERLRLIEAELTIEALNESIEEMNSTKHPTENIDKRNAAQLLLDESFLLDFFFLKILILKSLKKAYMVFLDFWQI